MSYRPRVREDSKAPPYFYQDAEIRTSSGTKYYKYYSKTTKIPYADVATDQFLKKRIPFYVRHGEKAVIWAYKNRQHIKWLLTTGIYIPYEIYQAFTKIQKETDNSDNNARSKYYGRFNNSRYCYRCVRSGSKSRRCRKCFLKHRGLRQRQNSKRRKFRYRKY